MNAVAYLPDRDELVAGSCRVKGAATRVYGSFKLCWDKDLVVRGIAVRGAVGRFAEFRRALHTFALGGMLAGACFSDNDIAASRRELLELLERRS